MSETLGAMLNPETFVEGTGLIDDVDATVKEARFALWDYDGKANKEALVARITLDVDGDEHIQYYSAGDPKFFVPSEDGRRAIPTGSKTALNNNTNLAQLLVSLFNAGYPAEKATDDIGAMLDGLNAHWNRVAQPKRDGLPKAEGQRDRTVLVISKINSLPGAKAGGAKKAAGTAGKTATAPAKQQAAPAEDLDDKLQPIVMEALSNGPLSKAKLSQAVFKAMAQDPDRNAAIKRVAQDDFLNSGPWEFDGSTVSLG